MRLALARALIPAARASSTRIRWPLWCLNSGHARPSSRAGGGDDGERSGENAVR